jgi:hypothetical protein
MKSLALLIPLTLSGECTLDVIRDCVRRALAKVQS